MATLDDDLAAAPLELFAIPDDVNRLPIRSLYLSKQLIDWVDGTLVYHTAKVAGRFAYEHLEAAFIDFRCNPLIHADDLKRMMPTSKGVWKMHPPMLRVYGWCPRKDSFVAILAELETSTKEDNKLNDVRRDDVLAFIARYNLGSHVKYGDFLDVFPQKD